MPKRRSGLSVPKRSMASCQVIRSIAPAAARPPPPRSRRATASVTTAWTSSWVDERRLDVELGELELAVGPQVLVAQAAGDLEVAVDARHHQQLLGDLRALGQHVEVAVVQPRRARRTPGPLRASASTAAASRPRRSPGAPWRPRMARVAPRPAAAGCAASAAGAGRRSGSAGAPPRRSRPGRRPGTAAARPRPAPRPCSRPARPRRWRSSALTVPSGRRRTVPSTRDAPTRCARRRVPSTTHWTMPVWSRRSTKARCSPCSRRRATQPHSATGRADVVDGRSSPHSAVRIAVASRVTGRRSCRVIARSSPSAARRTGRTGRPSAARRPPAAAGPSP